MGMTAPVGVLLVNFGGPQGPAELEPFLRELLLDVLPGPGWLKAPLAPRLARLRAAKMLSAYEAIGWSDVVPAHARQVAAVRAVLGPDAPPIASGMMFTAPTMRDAVRSLADVERIVAVPMFPHYSFATTQAAYTFAWNAMRAENMADKPVHWVPAWFDHPGYVSALAATIRAGVAATPGEGPLHLVFTPHGLPWSFVRRGDPYPEQVRESARRVIAELAWREPWWLGWQSRVGPAKWLEPSTPDVLARLGAEGVSRVCLVPISFVSEHIETRYEVDVEYREIAHRAGIVHFGRAPTLDVQPAFVDMLADVITAAVERPAYRCVRCLIPQPDAWRRRPSCPTCRLPTPAFLREAAS
jgi:protoporphyrin/coproporphyrin ferrochelatase